MHSTYLEIESWSPSDLKPIVNTIVGLQGEQSRRGDRQEGWNNKFHENRSETTVSICIKLVN